MTPARATAAVAALCASAVAVALGAASVAQRSLPADALLPRAPFPPLAMRRVDAHAHFGPATTGDAVRLAEANGVTALVNLSGGSPGGALEAALAAARTHGPRVAVAMELDLDGCCSAEWSAREAGRVAAGKALGARALSVSEALGLLVRDEAAHLRGAAALDARVPLDADALEPVWRACAGAKLPVVLHADLARAWFEPPGPQNERADELALYPERAWSDRARFPPREALLAEAARLVARHGDVVFVGAHFAGDAEDPAAVARLMSRLPNLWIDTAGRVPELARRGSATRAALLAHPDRVLFGTDVAFLEAPDWKAVVYASGQPYLLEGDLQRGAAMARFFDGAFRFFETRDAGIPSPTPIQGSADLEGIGLPRDVLERLYHRNAERLLGLAAEGP